MSKKKPDKKRHSEKSSASFITKRYFVNFWNEKRPVLIFVLGFGVLMAVFYSFWFSEIFKTNVLEPVVGVNAVVSSKVLNLFGFGTKTNGSDLFSSALTISIKQGCDAIEPIAIYAFAVLLFPVSIRSKLYGVLVGVPMLWLLNQVRIISLFLFGLYSPTLFEIMHVQVWQALFIAITLISLAYWIIWAMKKDGLKTVSTT